jgi:hypothetical protein
MAILYQLRCSNQHEFEGWFPSITHFDSQKTQGQLRCPLCGTKEVDRAIMSPRLGKNQKTLDKKLTHQQRLNKIKDQVLSPTEMMMGTRVKEMMRTVRDVIKRECEFVGDRFVEEVKKFEDGERDDRFYGTPSEEEAKKLMDEGVDLFVVPDVKDDA